MPGGVRNSCYVNDACHGASGKHLDDEAARAVESRVGFELEDESDDESGKLAWMYVAPAAILAMNIGIISGELRESSDDTGSSADALLAAAERNFQTDSTTVCVPQRTPSIAPAAIESPIYVFTAALLKKQDYHGIE